MTAISRKDKLKNKKKYTKEEYKAKREQRMKDIMNGIIDLSEFDITDNWEKTWANKYNKGKLE